MALKFKLRQLSEENKDLRGDGYEEEEEYDYENDDMNPEDLRKKVNELQDENRFLR